MKTALVIILGLILLNTFSSTLVLAQENERNLSAREPASAVPVGTILEKQVEDVSYKFTPGFDFYYAYNLNNPPNLVPNQNISLQPNGNNHYRAWDLYHDSFALNLAELRINATKADFTVDLSLGTGSLVDSLAGPDEVNKHLLHGTIKYSPTELKDFSLTFGKMITHLGIEPIRASENINYSRSLGFNYALPFYHVGLGLSYDLKPQVLSAAAFLYDGTYSAYDFNHEKMWGTQLNWTPNSKFNIIYGTLFGGETSSLSLERSSQSYHNINFIYKMTDSLQISADLVKGFEIGRSVIGKNGQREWFSWAGYISYKVSEANSFGIRIEGFDDPNHVRISGSSFAPQTSHLNSYTTTWNINVSKICNFRIEHRTDTSSNKVFTTRTDQVQNNQSTITLAALLNL